MEKTKNKNKLIKRIGALLCALVVLVGIVGVESYCAYDDRLCHIASLYADEFILDGGFSYNLHSYVEKYPYYIIVKYENGDYYTVFCYDDIPRLVVSGKYDYDDEVSDIAVKLPLGVKKAFYYYPDSNKWTSWTNYDPNYNYFIGSLMTYKHDNSLFNSPSVTHYLVDSNVDLFLEDSGKLFFSVGPLYNSNIGYLKNVRMHTVFDDVPLGETTGEKWTSRWYYDQYSTTGIDLTSGDYMINYYQERWVVKGYGADDVVEKSDRYLLGTYIVQNGYIETYSEDIESTLQGQGYEEPSMLDLLWNKFITTHYYFQIVDSKNNQVGGVLHIYLTDDNGKFGVEHIGETLDDKGEYDDDGYKDFIEDDSITTDDVEQGFDELEQDNEQTLEEWLEGLGGFTSDGLDDMDGADNFSDSLKSCATQIGNVTSGVGAMFSVLPPWILGLLGIAFCCLFVLIVVKVARG